MPGDKILSYVYVSPKGFPLDVLRESRVPGPTRRDWGHMHPRTAYAAPPQLDPNRGTTLLGLVNTLHCESPYRDTSKRVVGRPFGGDWKLSISPVDWQLVQSLSRSLSLCRNLGGAGWAVSRRPRYTPCGQPSLLNSIRALYVPTQVACFALGCCGFTERRAVKWRAPDVWTELVSWHLVQEYPLADTLWLLLHWGRRLLWPLRDTDSINSRLTTITDETRLRLFSAVYWFERKCVYAKYGSGQKENF